tara:strand:- start:1346 stop:1519 length:174 start_codon:yes stop_codon:yes gene_type:complete
MEYDQVINDLSYISQQRQSQIVKFARHIEDLAHLLKKEKEELQQIREEKEYQSSALE